MPASPPGRPRALFLGDSYTSGWGLADADLPLRWTTLVADARGWEEANAGFPGAGYVASGPVSRAPYRQILPRLTDARPDVVMISGGINDLYADDARIAKAIHSTLRALAATFPGAPRLAVTAVSPAPAATAARIDALNDALRAACAEHGATLLDVGQPLASADGLVGPDGLHPTVAGHATLAASVGAALTASGAPTGLPAR